MQTWTRYTTSGPNGSKRPDDFVELGPGHSDGLDRRLLGDVSGQRVLDLGAGAGKSSIALAKLGARVVAIEPQEVEVSRMRAAAEMAEVHVEAHVGGLADLAFLPADAFDAILSIHSLAAVDDIGRVFRQAHRLLRADRSMVLTLPHPASMIDQLAEPETQSPRYGIGGPLGGDEFLTYPHTVGHVFTQLTRANFRVDTLLEPQDGDVPSSLIVRAKKVGS